MSYYRGMTTERALEALEEVFATGIAPERVAAIIIEPVQGDGGFLPAPPQFLKALREITKRHGIVLIADEIQTGFGRTGKLFAFEHAGNTDGKAAGPLARALLEHRPDEQSLMIQTIGEHLREGGLVGFFVTVIYNRVLARDARRRTPGAQ